MSDVIDGTVLLSGVVGSTAYGLATPESDIDLLGMFAAPTTAFCGLHRPEETYKTTAPDTTFHEAAKYLRLALNGNPTVTELVWLGSYQTLSEWGQELIDIRSDLLSYKRVRTAYFGYASQQFRRIKNREDNTFSSDTRKRTAKHARHLWRLLQQGVELHQTGQLTVRLTPEEAATCREFGERVAAGDLELPVKALTLAEDAFDDPGVLPDHPREDVAEEWLLSVREASWDGKL